VPLTAAEDTGAGAPDLDAARRRLARLCAVYGDAGDRVTIAPEIVVPTAVTRLRELAAFTAQRAAAGAQHVQPHVQIYVDDALWIEEHACRLA
jgi:hypothetical protein